MKLIWELVIGYAVLATAAFWVMAQIGVVPL